MPKKIKLNLNDLKVDSFVTDNKLTAGAMISCQDTETYTGLGGQCSKRWCGSSEEQTHNCTKKGNWCA